jgi:hypothetical protein
MQYYILILTNSKLDDISFSKVNIVFNYIAKLPGLKGKIIICLLLVFFILD